MADPLDDARAVFGRAGELLFAIWRVRVALEAAEDLPAAQLPERRVYLTTLESFERSMLAALEDVGHRPQPFRGDSDAEHPRGHHAL